MRKLIFLALAGIALLFNSAQAQTNPDKIYDFVSIEKAPEYPGGIPKFYQYLGKAIIYPEAAKKAKPREKYLYLLLSKKMGL